MEESDHNVEQKQFGGKGSRQYQKTEINKYYGITEERARTVFAEMVPQALSEYSQEAYETADRRIKKFESIVMPRIIGIENRLNIFADPAFQMMLRKAQQTAAATEREDDYSLLSELLVCRIQKGDNRKSKTGIRKAIEIVDDIDNDALCALTVAHAISIYLPISGNIDEGLKTLDDLFSKLTYMNLPEGTEWIEHLDILGAVRIERVNYFKKMKDYYPNQLCGYSCVGLKKECDDYYKAIALLSSIGLNSNILVDNPLLDGYVKLPVRNKEAIRDLNRVSSNGQRKLNDEEVNILEMIWDLYIKDDNLQSKVNDNFMLLWDSHPSLKVVHDWWDNMPLHFDITGVGAILAHTNAKRCDSTIPDLI